MAAAAHTTKLVPKSSPAPDLVDILISEHMRLDALARSVDEANARGEGHCEDRMLNLEDRRDAFSAAIAAQPSSSMGGAIFQIALAASRIATVQDAAKSMTPRLKGLLLRDAERCLIFALNAIERLTGISREKAGCDFFCTADLDGDITGEVPATPV